MKLFITVMISMLTFSANASDIECRFGKHYDDDRETELMNTFFFSSESDDNEEVHDYSGETVFFTVYRYDSRLRVIIGMFKLEGGVTKGLNSLNSSLNLAESRFNTQIRDTVNKDGSYELACFPSTR